MKPAEQLLSELTAAGPGTEIPGYHVRRCLPESPLDIFLGRETPTGRCTLILQVNISDIPARIEALSTRAVAVELLRLPVDTAGRISIVVSLLEQSLEDQYCTVVDHLFLGLAKVRSARDGARLLAARLRAWLTFFARDSRNMPETRQRGLLGELCSLRAFAASAMDYPVALHAWTGPDRDDRDFTFPGLYTEVKTNVAGGRDFVRISNEFQLCVDAGADLLLQVLTLTEDAASGISLPEMVRQMTGELESDPGSLLVFEEKLSEAGYSDIHFARLAVPSYRVSLERVFQVNPAMPSICARTLQPGILHVTYDLDLRECNANLITQDLFMGAVRRAVQPGIPAAR